MIRRSFLAQLLAAPLAFVAAWKARGATNSFVTEADSIRYAELRIAAINKPIIGAAVTPDVFSPFNLDDATLHINGQDVSEHFAGQTVELYDEDTDTSVFLSIRKYKRHLFGWRLLREA